MVTVEPSDAACHSEWIRNANAAIRTQRHREVALCADRMDRRRTGGAQSGRAARSAVALGFPVAGGAVAQLGAEELVQPGHLVAHALVQRPDTAKLLLAGLAPKPTLRAIIRASFALSRVSHSQITAGFQPSFFRAAVFALSRVRLRPIRPVR